jgi:cell division protein FtsZ
VQHMVDHHIEGVEFVCANTDAQALQRLTARTLLQLGSDITKGLGAGANPSMGKSAALEDKERIQDVLEGADMVFITAGMGGGTGTGAAPIVAQIARELGILTVAVVTKPFPFEGRKRMQIAEAGIAELSEYVDSLITVPNEKLLSIMGQDTPLLEAFGAVDDVLLGAVQGIADLIIRPGMINVDFADVRTVMSEMGMAMMGSGAAVGGNRALEAAEAAVRSPLLDDIDFSGARGILVNIAAGVDITLTEFSQVGATIENFASDNATVVIGTVIDPEMGEEMRVTVVATGLGLDKLNKNPELPAALRRRLAGDGVPDYQQLDRPTVIRNKAIQEGGAASTGQQQDLEYLDIPAFLRRQAD